MHKGSGFLLLALLLASLVAGAPVGAQTGGEVVASADLGAEGTTSTATFYDLGNGSTQVVLVLSGLAAGSHAAHIHTNSCSGPVLYPLRAATADAAGAARSETIVAAKFAPGQWYVDVHTDASETGKALACGQVNPAMAGGAMLPPPAGGTPNLPTTGTPDAPGLLLGGGAALGLLMLGWRVRRHSRA